MIKGQEVSAIEGYLVAANKFKDIAASNKSSMDSVDSMDDDGTVVDSYFDQFLFNAKGA